MTDIFLVLVFVAAALLGAMLAWIAYELGRDNPRSPFDD